MKKIIALMVTATFGLASFSSMAAPQPTPNTPAATAAAPAPQYAQTKKAQQKPKAPKKAKKRNATPTPRKAPQHVIPSTPVRP